MPARFVTTSLVTKHAGIAARFVTLVTKRAVVTKHAATRLLVLPLPTPHEVERCCWWCCGYVNHKHAQF